MNHKKPHSRIKTYIFIFLHNRFFYLLWKTWICRSIYNTQLKTSGPQISCVQLKLTWWTDDWLSVKYSTDGRVSCFDLCHLQIWTPSSCTQVHPRTIRCCSGCWLQCYPGVPRPRLPWTPGHLEERGWASSFQQTAYAWQYHTEQGGSTYHQ